MARQKIPPKPYYTVVHDFNDSLRAFQEASTMLYAAVSNVLSMRELISKDSTAKKLLDHLQEHAENYRKAVHGDL